VLEIELAQPFDESLILNLVPSMLDFQDKFLLLQPKKRVSGRIQRGWLPETQLASEPPASR